MSRTVEELQEMVATLGKAAMGIGRSDLASQLRIYSLSLQRGPGEKFNAGSVHWSEESVVDWLGLFQVPPYADQCPIRPEQARCEKCVASPNPRAYLHVDTLADLPSGRARKCRKCGAVWLERRTRQ